MAVTAGITPDTSHGLAIDIEGVEMEYHSPGRPVTTAVTGVDLTIVNGEFVAIVGQSGCGKTTLLRIIAGLLNPTSGAVKIGGAVVEEPRRDVSIMFQTPTLLPWRKVIDNCVLPLELEGRRRKELHARAMELLTRARLADFAERYPNELSGGMQQRAALCRALMATPSVLLLDEPFGALDALTREEMNIYLHEVWAENAVITVLITHSIPEAVFLAQRVVVMSSRPGRIAEIVDVPLPAHRDQSVMASEEFVQICAHIRSHFIEGGTAHVE